MDNIKMISTLPLSKLVGGLKEIPFSATCATQGEDGKIAFWGCNPLKVNRYKKNNPNLDNLIEAIGEKHLVSVACREPSYELATDWRTKIVTFTYDSE